MDKLKEILAPRPEGIPAIFLNPYTAVDIIRCSLYDWLTSRDISLRMLNFFMHMGGGCPV